tara:strand:- start:3990 stop:4535 length:546 start_codon:yes stop_codon:yes gene_type:complete
MDLLLSLIKKIDKLRVAKGTVRAQIAGGRASYKPILILVILGKIEKGASNFSKNRIYWEKCRKSYVRLYESIRGKQPKNPVDDSMIVQPFWNLATGPDNFWEIKVKTGKEEKYKAIISESKKRNSIKRANQINELVEYAYFDEATWEVMNDKTARDLLIDRIIEKHLTVSVRECLESATKD